MEFLQGVVAVLGAGLAIWAGVTIASAAYFRQKRRFIMRLAQESDQHTR